MHPTDNFATSLTLEFTTQQMLSNKINDYAKDGVVWFDFYVVFTMSISAL